MFRYLVFLGLLAYCIPFVASQCQSITWDFKRYRGIELDTATVCNGFGIAFSLQSKPAGRRRALSSRTAITFNNPEIFYTARANCFPGEDPSTTPDLVIEYRKLSSENSAQGWKKLATLKAEDFATFTTKKKSLDEGIYRFRASQRPKKGQRGVLLPQTATWGLDIQFCPENDEPTATPIRSPSAPLSPSAVTSTAVPSVSASASASASSAAPPSASASATPVASPSASASST